MAAPMPDWADFVAAQLLDAHAVMRGDKIAVLKASFEPALAAKLRIIRKAAAVETVARAEANVADLYGRAS